MAIRKSEEQNAERRRQLALRLFGSVGGAVVAALLAFAVVTNVSLPSPSSNDDDPVVEPQDPVAVETVTMTPDEEGNGTKVYRGVFSEDIAEMRAEIETGRGLGRVVVRFSERSWAGSVDVDGNTGELRRGAREFDLTMDEGLTTVTLHRGDSGEATFEMLVEFPPPR